MSELWGPWIEHDGARLELVGPLRLEMGFNRDGLRKPSDDEAIDADYPGWFWRWRRVRDGWFSTRLVRVCDDPTYSPILRYRVRRPRGLTLLRDIAAGLRQPEGAEA